jgi:hypothetical protein
MSATKHPPAGLNVELLPVGDLYLDPHNPRLAGRGLALDDQREILAVLWKEMAVNELVDSIAATGYWEYEELFAAQESGKLVVIEGNRRLAAVMLLLDEGVRQAVGASGIPTLPDAAKEKLQSLPVITCSRQEVWEYVGFKHVNGPQEWDSIAKAEYIARVHNEYKIPLEDIARNIGDRHDTVRRLYRGLMALEQAEHAGVFHRDDRWNKRFAYSHLWTGLGYSGVQTFLGLGPDKGYKPSPIPKSKLKNLGELLVWLYGSKEEQRKPLVLSQNPDLRNLDEVLRSPDGVAALRAELPLDIALKASRGDERLLREALVKAETALKEARGLMPTGYSKQSDVYENVKRIKALAESIYNEVVDASMPGLQTRDRRRTRE